MPLRVVDPEGKPVAGARILYDRDVADVGLLPDVLLERLSATTGADGWANLSAFSPEDVAGVTIESKAFGTQRLKTDPKAKGEQTLTLGAVGRLSGRIMVEAPEKADGLRVWGMTRTGLAYGETGPVGHFEVATDTEGRFEVPALVAGSVMVVILNSEKHPNLIRDRSREKPVVVVAGKLAEVEIAMKAGVLVRGVLRERGSRRPLAGAMVRFSTTGGNIRVGHSVRTDRSGQFKSFFLPDDLKISLTLGDAGPYVLAQESPISLGMLMLVAPIKETSPQEPPIKREAPPAPPIKSDTPLVAGDELDAGVVEVVHGVSVRGVVRDEQGKPVASAAIGGWASSNGRSVFSPLATRAPLSDARGEFVMENLVPGRSVEVTARLGEAATATPTVVIPGETRDVTLVVSPANTVSLGGRVVNEYGKPIANARVGVRSRWKTSTGAEVRETPYVLHAASKIVTDAEGRFQIPRTLSRHAQHQAEALAPGRGPNTTVWFASTTPTFFDLPLFPTYPPEQSQIWADRDAGWAANNIGDYAEAEVKFRSALKGASEKKISDPLLLAWLHEGLGYVLFNRGQISDAERERRIVLELREKALPADHAETVKAMRWLASACMRQEKYDEAEKLLGRASAIMERRSSTDHPEFGWTLFDTGHLAILRGQNADAVPLLERACRVLETAFGSDNPDLIDYLDNLGYALAELERFEEAEAIDRRALKLAETVDGMGGPKTANALARLLFVLRKQGKDAEADELEARPRRVPDR